MARLKLQRNYGLSHALSLGIGTMIGAGIFILPSFAAGRAGPASSISYLIGGLIAVLTAFSLSELATGMSKAGGSYYFINRSLGPFFGTITGIGMWMGLIFASAFYMIGFEYYLSDLFGFDIAFSGYVIDTKFVTVLITFGLVAINYFGTKGAGDFQKIIVYLLLVILAIFIIWGALHMHFGMERTQLKPFAPEGWGSVAGVAALVFIGFLGFEVIATAAEEIKDPDKNIWRAMIGSVVIVTILYMVIMLVTTGIVHYETLSDQETPVSYAADIFMGEPGRIIITFAALLATISSANASILSASRVSLAMGKDRILHPWTQKLHDKFATPSHSILITGALIFVFLIIGLVDPLPGISLVEMLAEVTGFMFLMTFVLLHCCVWVLRRTQPEWYTPSFRSPFFPYTQIIGASLCLILIGYMSFNSIGTGLVLVGLSLVWYRYWSRKRSKVVGEVKKVFTDKKIKEAQKVIQEVEEKQKKILVPFSNALYETWKMKLAASLATEKGVMVRLNIVEIPDQTPIESAMDHIVVDNIKKMDMVKTQDTKAPGEKEYKQIIAHSVPYTIVNVSRQEGCELLFLSKSRPVLPTARIKETITNFILHKARVDIAVLSMTEEVKARLKPTLQPKIKKIMVPFDDNPHTILALEFARNISIAEGASVTLFVVSFKKDLKENQKKIKRILQDYKSDLFKIEPKIIIGRSPAKEIIRASPDFSLIVMGASRLWVLNKFLFGSIPDRVIRAASCPVLMAKKWERGAFSQVKARI